MFELRLKCHWPEGSNQQYSSIVSDNGLALSKWEAIIWTYDDYMRHYVEPTMLTCVIRPQWFDIDNFSGFTPSNTRFLMEGTELLLGQLQR